MDILRTLKILTLLFLGSGCAKFSYVVEQGIGQLSLQWRGVPNHKLLDDDSIAPEIKKKIREVEQYKSYFYAYWEREESEIYSKTTLLDRSAVTYLVVASPYDRIEPVEECFWFVGCFPYLGFFNENSAKKYQKRLERREYVTMRRPVYAYSTLGRFNDRLLSSFFVFHGIDLAELIFHELYHTIFFVKSEVDLNENLANFFGREMALEYFNVSAKERKDQQEREEIQSELRREVVRLTRKLNEHYRENHPLDLDRAKELMDKFMKAVFFPSVTDKCTGLGLDLAECWPLHHNWNNARLAAFMTYERQGRQVQALYEREGRSLRALQLYIEEKYEQYQSQRPHRKSFEDFLFSSLGKTERADEIPAYHDKS